jgi:hypothetical protein
LAAEGRRRPEYDLDFGSRNLHDILYYFHRGDAKSARVPEIAEAFEYPLFAQAPPAWYSDTEAWYFEISRNRPDDKNLKSNDGHWVPDGLGIAHHGQSGKGGSYNSGGHHESLSSGWLPFLRTGHLSELERNLVLSRWAISQNPGWAFENNVIAFGEGPRRYAAVDRAFADLNGLAGFGPKDFYVWKSEETREVQTPKGVETRLRGGSTYFNEYKALPDIEHYGLFSLFLFTMLLVVTSNNIIMMWVAVEATTLGSAFLVGIYGHHSSLEAAWNNEMKSSSRRQGRMPRPPPPAVALIMTGKPMRLASDRPSLASARISVPGVTGTPLATAVARAVALSPIIEITLAEGPMNCRLQLAQISAKRAFSDRKP